MKKLVIVDDDKKLISLLSFYFLKEGFNVSFFDNVPAALVSLKQEKPDLIITDIMMKSLNGYDFIKLLKLDMLFLDIPVIFLTAKGLTEDRIKGYNLGCHAYLTKPFNPKELLAIIRSIFENIKLYKNNQVSFFSKKKLNHDIFNLLTYREKTILNLLVKGYMNKEIAINLNTSLRNVEKYVSRLLSKTQTRNRTELVKVLLE
uniref:TctD-like protein n=1 Tax=Taenioma perpusillum TaxID=210852 RepID=A0A1Z1MRY0_9FLOR|nr:hypothetical protein [Taenioma perpusillum]ARW68592.1 hypothetical protein [Taenioma perpusillum]